MERRTFLFSGASAGLAFTLKPLASHAKSDVAVEAAPQASFPVLMNPTEGRISVGWVTDSPDMKAWVEFGLSPDQMTFQAPAAICGFSRITRVKVARLEGLQSGLTYHYRLCARPLGKREHPGWQSDVFSFTQLGDSTHETSFAVINDTHENPKVIEPLISRIHALKPHFFAWNGDVFNFNDNEDQIIRNFYQAAPVPYGVSTPMVYCRGNHDCRGKLAPELHNLVGRGSNEGFFHTFRVGPVAFIVLDTCEDKVDARLPDRVFFEHEIDRQRLFLESIKGDPSLVGAQKRVLLCHIPLWVRNTWNYSWLHQKWLDKLLALNVDIIISGHVHHHHFLPKGVKAAELYDPVRSQEPVDVAIPQLIGGGPSVQSATLIRGKFSDGKLQMQVENLEGKILWKESV